MDQEQQLKDRTPLEMQMTLLEVKVDRLTEKVDELNNLTGVTLEILEKVRSKVTSIGFYMVLNILGVFFIGGVLYKILVQ